MLTGSRWVRVLGAALREASKLWPKAKNRRLVRRQGLKLRFWPEHQPADEGGIILDLDWEWIKALKGKKVGELRVDDIIGGLDNIRIVFFVAEKREGDPMPIIWILAALQKKRQGWTKAQIVWFDARRKLVLKRGYDCQ